MASTFEMIPLCSGSSGNSILVRAKGMNLLFDLGLSCKRIVEALEKVGTDPSSVDAVFLSHSHSDHISGADVFIRKYNTDVYATKETLRSFLTVCKKEHAPCLDHEISEEIVFETDEGDVKVLSCCTPHDTAGSVCFKVCADDRSLMIMTDLGHVTDDIKSMAKGVDGILIESNYDYEMLITGPYDYVLKRRVGGPYGHLSNEDCAEMIRELIESGTRRFMLGHLSENNNIPDLAVRTVVDYLSGFGFAIERDYELDVAKRYEPSAPLVVCP
ncbi:MAG: MBL fold metallo-hydrolase [Clostridiales bacterium]|nr:MBL fold metallo-hydrolase [Clostridiales bacterium]